MKRMTQYQAWKSFLEHTKNIRSMIVAQNQIRRIEKKTLQESV